MRALSGLLFVILFIAGYATADFSGTTSSDDKGVAKEARAKTREAFAAASGNNINGEGNRPNPAEEFYSSEVAEKLIQKEARPHTSSQPHAEASEAIRNNPVTDGLIGKEPRSKSATEARDKTSAKFHATQASGPPRSQAKQNPSDAFYSSETADKVIEKEARPGEYRERITKIEKGDMDHLAQRQLEESLQDSSASPQYFMKDILVNKGRDDSYHQQQPNAHAARATTIDEKMIEKEARAKTPQALHAAKTAQRESAQTATGQDARRRSLANGRRD